jgi:tetratricopeptide (TPR) repeat protein
VGVIVFEILTKKPAFATLGLLAGYKVKQDFPVTMLTDAGVSQPGVDFVLSLMCPNPNDRMTAASAISDAWIQSPMLQPLGSTKAITGELRVPSPATTMTEVSVSWTTRTYSEAPEDVSHNMPSSTTTVELVNAAQDRTIVPQEKRKIHSSLGTRVPVIVQGQGQVETLEFRPAEFRSQHQTGDSYYRQKMYKEAETMFRQALQGREKTLGPDHEDTLYSAHSLGLSLYRQKGYKKAEAIFRQALQGRDRVLGHNHAETLSSTHWLGLSLYYQKRYEEAEIEFRRALQGREETLGYDHKDTLYSANQLAMSLYDQDQYKEAETMSRRALEGREKVLGHEHEETLNSTHRVGLSLYYQKRYKAAAPMFRRALLGREKTLGYDHRHTLYSAYWLGLSLYYQRQYKEAETMLRRTLQGREKTLGHDHEETVNARECMDKAHTRALGL